MCHLISIKTLFQQKEFIMEIIELKCSYCNRDIYVQKDYIREKMFCTLGCMYLHKAKSSEIRKNTS